MNDIEKKILKITIGLACCYFAVSLITSGALEVIFSCLALPVIFSFCCDGAGGDG